MRFGQSTADDVGRGGGMKTKRDSKGGATDKVRERERGRKLVYNISEIMNFI